MEHRDPASFHPQLEPDRSKNADPSLVGRNTDPFDHIDPASTLSAANNGSHRRHLEETAHLKFERTFKQSHQGRREFGASDRPMTSIFLERSGSRSLNAFLAKAGSVPWQNSLFPRLPKRSRH